MNLLDVESLEVFLGPEGSETRVLRDISFSIQKGETLGIVGESGCGKSMTALAISGLLPEPHRLLGSISFNGQRIEDASLDAMRTFRGKKIAMIFQEPMTALNPVLTVGFQIAEMLVVHEGQESAEAYQNAIKLLEQVGISDPAQRAKAYPHELSGGMRQRVMIAIAMACRPDLLIADEPTTALDVSVQAQILDLMLKLQNDYGTALMFISHNFGVISEMADRVMVMYAGKVVEQGLTTEVLQNPQHPYTRGLMRALPDVSKRVSELNVIQGQVPSLSRLPQGCSFAPRCPDRTDKCLQTEPLLKSVLSSSSTMVACIHA
jgi:oligopeptide/dipeptide ABC transporter ATP-binding protein